MAPTLPYFRPPHQCAAADAIAISSSGSDTNTLVMPSSSSLSGSDQSITNTLIVVSSATSSRSVLIIPDSSASRGGDRSAPQHQHPLSPAPYARSVTAASFANRGWRTAAAPAPRQCLLPCFAVRTTGGVAPAPPSNGGGGGGGDNDVDEATSRPKRKARYRKWSFEDEVKVLDTLANLRRDNLGLRPQASVLLSKICADVRLDRRRVDSTELSDKVSKLKKKFVKTAAKVAGGKRLRKHRDHVLFGISMEVWPDALASDIAAAVSVQVAKAARRRREWRL